ncbi:MAG TPA: molybdopterin-dependent oxidoreductase [Clostridiales bacterium]|nr:molybdopterin-dependent oxidoreductase [Clostridiales bacterium]
MKLRKMTLHINGANRTFIFNPETDTLASVLRRLGLTGTKIGCGTGVCGACSVVLNGKVIRSCTRRMKAVDEYSSVVTVEGLGNPMNPHPLQAAMVHMGAVQCGFCTPGFVVSAYGLLLENPSPTREDVRDWFQKHRNVCRCTGYKQIVDAVMEAAAIMRGEKTIDDIAFDWKAEKDGYYGKPLPRPVGLSKACGVADYGDDVELHMPAETLKVVPVMPRVAHHAKILSIDYSEAEKMPGVVKVITAEDIKEANRLQMYQYTPRTTAFDQVHKLITDDTIVNWGNIVALVAADTKDHALAAAKKVKVEVEPLPEYLNYLDAAMPDAKRIHPTMDNVWSFQPLLKGDSDKVPELIDGAAHSVEGSFYASREPHMSIEGDTVQAYYDDEGIMNVHCKTMTLYWNRDEIAEATGIPAEKIRVIQNPTGGSFGWAIAAATFALAAIACKVLDRPVALSMDYSQYMAFSGKRSPAFFNGRLACDADGKIVAGEFDSGLDHGSYLELGDDVISKIVRFMFFPYYIPNAAGLARVATTNHAYGTAYRGYGSPQAYTCGESLIDMLAIEAGIDPFEFRWRNIARPGQTNLNSVEFLQYPMEKMMEIMKPYYEKAVADAKAADTPEKRRGVGLAWGGFNVGAGPEDEASVAIELAGDGKFIKYDTWQDQGQGGDIGSLMVTLEALRPYFKDVTPDDITLIQNDSKYCPNTGESASSRSHFVNGKASILAVEDLVNAMRKEDGSLRTYDEMIAEGIPTRYEATFTATQWPHLSYLDPNTGEGNPTYAYTYAFYLAEVEVDVATGKTTVIGLTCVDRVGKVGNIQAVNGQAYGGMSHSIGYALSEQYEDVKKHTNPLSAGIPYIKDVPDKIEAIHIDAHEEIGPFGSSGASEAFQSSGHVAVLNAIYNATGVRIYELPALPEKVKAGIDALQKGETVKPPKKYFLGSDLYEELEKIKANPVE